MTSFVNQRDVFTLKSIINPSVETNPVSIIIYLLREKNLSLIVVVLMLDSSTICRPAVLLSACATMDTQGSSSGTSCPSATTCLAVPCCSTRLRWGAMAWTSESFSSSHPWLLSSLPRNESSDPPVTMTNGVLELNIRGMAISLSLSVCIYVVRTGNEQHTYKNMKTHQYTHTAVWEWENLGITLTMIMLTCWCLGGIMFTLFNILG